MVHVVVSFPQKNWGRLRGVRCPKLSPWTYVILRCFPGEAPLGIMMKDLKFLAIEERPCILPLRCRTGHIWDAFGKEFVWKREWILRLGHVGREDPQLILERDNLVFDDIPNKRAAIVVQVRLYSRIRSRFAVMNNPKGSWILFLVKDLTSLFTPS